MSSLRLAVPIVLFALLVVSPQAALSAAVVVYDNTSTGTSGWFVPIGLPQGFWPFNQFSPYELMGDQITLAGSERTVTQFDLLLSSSEPTTLSTLTLSFYFLESNGFPRSEPNWTTTIENVNVGSATGDGNTVVSIAVPGIDVPDTFVWAAAADSDVAGLATFNTPTVGSSSPWWYWDFDHSTHEWYPLAFDDDPPANFGARVLAVPEPATVVLLPLAGLLAARRSRARPRRRHGSRPSGAPGDGRPSAG